MASDREKELEKIIKGTLWMACRYAHGRQSYAVGLYNDSARRAQHFGVVQDRVDDEPLFALDGSLNREMSGLSQAEHDDALRRWRGRGAVPNFTRDLPSPPAPTGGRSDG